MKDTKKIVSALDVSHYLLSLDSKRKYFTINWMKSKENWESIPREGSFRLNKILHLCQMLYYAKYKKPLFKEQMLAFEHGAVVETVRINYLDLYWNLAKEEIKLEDDDKKNIKKIFTRFRSESNDTLENLTHEDPAWKLGNKQGNLQIMPINNKLINYYSDFLEDILEELEI